MIATPHESQVCEPVVQGVVVDVVDDMSVRDWPVGVFPDAPVLKLADVTVAVVPPEQPMAVLYIPGWGVSSFSFVISAASFGAVDASVASIGSFGASAT